MSSRLMLRKLARACLPAAWLQRRAAQWRLRQGLRAITGTVLEQYGYLNSLKVNRAVDAQGAPLPWYTYPAIQYLDALDFSKAKILEWGAGYSSAYWARRAANVASVEHDPAWVAEIQPLLGASNHALLVTTAAEEYIALPEPLAGRAFDLIVIDGLWRRACARTAVRRVGPGGMILLDNSNWFPKTCAWLRAQGLWQVDFHGWCPSTWNGSVTSLFVEKPAVMPAQGGALPGRCLAELPRDYDDHPEFGWPP